MEIGQIVGAVRVNESYKDTNRSFECAAWWEESEAIPGVYPLVVGYKDPLYPKSSEFHLYAKVAAVVTDDYFPALFGGVAISKDPYEPKHIGEKRTIKFGISLIDAINKTGTIAGESRFDVCLELEHWGFVLEDAKRRLEEAYNNLPQWWDEYQDGDNEHDSKVGMVGHFGEKLHKFAEHIRRINFRMRFLESQYNMGNNIKNTEWARLEKAG